MKIDTYAQGSTPESSHSQLYYVTTFYSFQPLVEESLQKIKADIQEFAKLNSIRGLIILGKEGINSTCCARSEQEFELFKDFIRQYFNVPHLMFKDSTSHIAPFRRLAIKIRKEIVTLGVPELHPDSSQNHHLNPTEWNRVMNEDKPLIIDTRNWYETKIGTFKGAINPNIDVFTEFPKFVEEQKISKEQKMLIFCTGGIRCEKGILELQRMGYDNVYQLEGGIIKYLEEYPHQQFEGECFVFDHRVALDQELKPTKKYGLCPHCGQPSAVEIQCKRCDSTNLICEDCHQLEFKKDTCSKNCAHQYQLHPDRKAPRQILPYESESY